MSVGTYFRQNWLGVVGLAVGIAGILLSVYFYSETIAEREPVFIVDSARTEIIRSERVTDTPLKVTRQTGEPIKGDITAVRTYFWNRGKLGIRPTNILEPITLSIDGEDSEVLDFKILRSSRNVVKPTIRRDESNPRQYLRLGFDILESGDGFSIQVIYVGNPNAKVSLAGAVEGVKSLTGHESLVKVKFWRELLLRASGLIVLLILFAVPVLLSKKKEDQWIEGFLTRFPRTAKTVVICLMVLALCLFLMFVVWIIAMPFQVVSNARRSAESSLIESVPPELIGGKPPQKGLGSTP